MSTISDANYAWDRENRLVRVDKLDGTVVEHTYDADGVRIRTVTTPSGGSAVTTNFLVDTSGSLSHVVAETNATGALVVHYVRGDDLLALMRPDGSGGWTSRFYHSDHIGSVRRLTNEAGQITDGYTYSAFGELLAHTGTDPQPYAFTGEPYDPNVGFQYHRARWMDPRVGRFLGMDPWAGSAFEPATLHRYNYGRANPVDRIDPSGESDFTVGSLLATMAIGGVINAMTVTILNRGDVTADQLQDAFVWGAVTAPVGGLLARAAGPIIKAALWPFARLIGAMPRIILRNGAPGWRNALVRISRHVFNTNRAYPGVASSHVGRYLRSRFPDLEWQMHHTFIQQSWSRVGSTHQLYDDLVANEGLRRLGNGLWNLIPLPKFINNNVFNQHPVAAQMFATAAYSMIVDTMYHVTEMIDALEDE